MKALSKVIETKNPFEQGMLTWKILFKALSNCLLSKNKFHNIECYCLFIGHPRSGHTVVGSILDAHPNITIAHELNTINLIRLGAPKRLLFELIIEKSRSFTQAGRKWSGYNYLIEEGLHNKKHTLKVLGDKKGDRAAILLGDNPELISKTFKTVGVPLKFIQVIRNPLDNISRHALRSKIGLNQAIDEYYAVCDFIEILKSKINKNDYYSIYHEELINDPKETIISLCQFLGQESSIEYIEKASNIVFKEPNLSRKDICWSDELISEVMIRNSKYSNLERYNKLTFDNKDT